MTRRELSAIGIGWVFGGSGLLASKALELETVTSLVIIVCLGLGSTLFMLNR